MAQYFFLALFLSLALVPICRFLATRRGLVALPHRDRWHDKPTALLGGVAIGVATFASVLTYILTTSSGEFGVGRGYLVEPTGDLRQVVLLSCAAVIFIVGLVDDLRDLKPFSKFILQIVVASVLLYFDYGLAWTGRLTIDNLLTIAWIVGITNAFNLLDNMDGLCAGVALITGFSLLLGMGPMSELSLEVVFLVALLGGTAGFLVYNFHPASIFMGDSGSLLIGLSLAVLSLGSEGLPGGSSNLLTVVGAPVLVLLIPILDTTLVTLSRIVSGRSAAQGGRDHSSHRLVAIGLSQRAAVGVLWALAAMGSVVGITLSTLSLEWSGLLASVFMLAIVIFAVYLAQIRVYDDNAEPLIRAGKITPFVVDIIYKRRIAEVGLDVVLITIAYYAAYQLRFEGQELANFFVLFYETLPIVLAVQMITLFAVGAYRGVWRYFGLMDAITFTQGVFAGTFITVGLFVYVYRFVWFSRSVFLIYAVVLLLLLTGSRVSFRVISEWIRRGSQAGDRLIIYGAGDGGWAAASELLDRQDYSYKMLGFVDDDKEKRHDRIQGYPVLGDYYALASLIKKGKVDCVVVSTQRIDAVRLGELEQLCAEHRIRLSRLQFDLKHLVTVS